MEFLLSKEINFVKKEKKKRERKRERENQLPSKKTKVGCYASQNK